ncbi:RsmD family RNA methyltransferase [Pseudoclavibacter soli]|uniref:RsmD family RNA methyltransferase n=1 Tax=Pseudoclavibacter soli TaxID=452623 RepID=UPI0003FAFAB1|nr:RsmD family RNA methyltransferase [Pseudoclavibacter soli]
MTRLIAGDAGGLTLHTPDSRTRPTTGRTREALFSRLDARLDFTDLRVLDLFAGSAALGLEAISRGAEQLVAVEKGRTAASIAARNAREVARAMPHRTVHIDVVPQRVETWLAQAPRDHFDLVFIDPPYDLDNAALTQVLVDLLPALATAADVVIERSMRSGTFAWPDGYREVAARRYGETMLWFAEGRLEA